MSTVLTEALGWFGSALLIFSLLQPRMLRLRVLNLIASGILVAYNAVVGVLPMVGVNAAIVVINVVFIARMLWAARDESSPTDGVERVASE